MGLECVVARCLSGVVTSAIDLVRETTVPAWAAARIEEFLSPIPKGTFKFAIAQTRLVCIKSVLLSYRKKHNIEKNNRILK